MTILTNLKDFYQEIRKVLVICSDFSQSQQKYNEFTQRKFLQIDGFLDNLLKTPFFLNKTPMKNLQKNSNSCVLTQNSPFFDEKSLKNIEKNLETQYFSLVKALKNSGNMKKTSKNSKEKENSGDLKKKYTSMVLKKLKNNGYFSLLLSKTPAEIQRKISLHQTKAFRSISSCETEKPPNFHYFSEKPKENRLFHEENGFKTPKKQKIPSENVDFEVEESKIHDISMPFSSKYMVNKLDTPLKEKEIISNLMRKEFQESDDLLKNYHHGNFFFYRILSKFR